MYSKKYTKSLVSSFALTQWKKDV